jgi:hypothetical protein
VPLLLLSNITWPRRRKTKMSKHEEALKLLRRERDDELK